MSAGVAEARGAPQATSVASLVSLRGVRLRRGDRWVLDGVDLDVARGECVAVLGPNGAGKSSLLRVLSLVEAPTEGAVRWEGLGAGEERLAARRRVATVAQEPYLFAGTALDNVMEGLRWRCVPRDEAARRAEEALSACGAGGLARRRARELSGGEGRRVAIARALALAPAMLLLDESLAHLDEATRGDLLALLDALPRRGTAVVLATHDLEDAARLAGRVYGVREGRPDAAGVENFFLGEVREEGGMHWFAHASGVRVAVATTRTGRAGAKVEPAEILLSAEPIQSSARNCLAGAVIAVETGETVARVRVDVGVVLIADVTPQSAREMGIAAGKKVYATFKATAVRIV